MSDTNTDKLLTDIAACKVIQVWLGDTPNARALSNLISFAEGASAMLADAGKIMEQFAGCDLCRVEIVGDIVIEMKEVQNAEKSV